MNDLEVYDNESPVVVTPQALEQITRGETDVAITTAKKWPRNLKQFTAHAINAATLDHGTAASCCYSLSRSGKRVEGPSVRLAEIIASAWGNMRVASRVVSDDGRFVTAQGVAHDLERNVAISTEVQRRITDKSGKTYSEDMIQTTAMAANAIARRNAILAAVPRCYWGPIYEKCKEVQRGSEATLEERRTAAIKWFESKGVKLPRLLEGVGRASVEDIGLDELMHLTGIRTAVKEGETTLEEAFPTKAVAPPGSKTDAMAEALKKPV